MKISRQLFPILAFCFLFACAKKEENNATIASEKDEKTTEFSPVGKAATIYTTAENTDKRLSIDGELSFQKAVQPLESEVAVFVNPNKKFQKFLVLVAPLLMLLQRFFRNSVLKNKKNF
jgi:glucosylceramidase